MFKDNTMQWIFIVMLSVSNVIIGKSQFDEKQRLNCKRLYLSQADNLNGDIAFNALKIRTIFRYITSSLFYPRSIYPNFLFIKTS